MRRSSWGSSGPGSGGEQHSHRIHGGGRDDRDNCVPLPAGKYHVRPGGYACRCGGLCRLRDVSRVEGVEYGSDRCAEERVKGGKRGHVRPDELLSQAGHRKDRCAKTGAYEPGRGKKGAPVPLKSTGLPHSFLWPYAIADTLYRGVEPIPSRGVYLHPAHAGNIRPTGVIPLHGECQKGTHQREVKGTQTRNPR